MIVEAYGLSYRYPGGVEALKNAYLSAGRGEVVSVVGANGSGKTTLLLAVAGLIEPDRGEVLLEGKPLREQLPGARRRIGFLFQDPDDQLFNPTVFDELAFSLRQLGLTEAEVEARVEEVSAELGLTPLLDRKPYRLSFGEKKLVALASILVYNPDILILDEPTSGLSLKLAVRVEELIRTARSDGRTVILASHNPDLVAMLSDRVYVVKDGVTLADGAVEEVLTDEQLLSEAEMNLPTALRLSLSLGLEKRILTVEDLILELRRAGSKIFENV